MPYAPASSVIVNNPLANSRTNSTRSSMGDVSRHGIEAPPAMQVPRPCGEKCYPCRSTEVLPMSLARALGPGPRTKVQGRTTDLGRTRNQVRSTMDHEECNP